MKLLPFLLVLFSLVSCNQTTSPRYGKIDDRLIGEWYNKQTRPSSNGPKEYITGIKIKENGQVYYLSIETSTGKIVRSSDSVGVFLNATSNSFSYEHYPSGMITTTQQKGSYSFRGDSLFFTKNDGLSFFDGGYKKTLLQTVLTQPIVSDFTIEINGTLYSNNKISRAPSAYSFFDENKLIIYSSGTTSETNNNWEFIGFRIEVMEYDGIGQYDSSSTIVFYQVLEGDVIYVSSTIDDSSEVNLHIESINDKQISGKLELKIGNTIFSDGDFNLPLY